MPSKTSIKAALQQHLKNIEFGGEISHSDKFNEDFISAPFEIDGNEYKIALIANDERKWMRVFLFSPISIPNSRKKEAAVVLNYINTCTYLGNIQMEDENKPFYRYAISVANCKPTAEMFSELADLAVNFFDGPTVRAIGALAFTNLTAEEIIKQFEEAGEAQGEEAGEEGGEEEEKDEGSAPTAL